MQTVKNHDNYSLERRMRWIAYKRLPKEYRRNDVLNRLAGRKDWTHVQQTDVVIGDRYWIGTRCIMLKGVNLGEGTIVGAASVVTKSFPPYSIIAGNPARLIRSQVETGVANGATQA